MPLSKPTKPAAVPAIPTPVPQRADRLNFAARGDATMTAMPAAFAGVNTSVDYVNDAANFIEEKANGAAADAVTAAAAAATATTLTGSSATSVAIGAGTKSFTASIGRGWSASQFLTLASAADNTRYMHGQVTSYNSTTGALVMTITDVGGSGSAADWLITVSAPRGASGPIGGALALVVETGTTVSCVQGTHHALSNVGSTTATLPGTPTAGGGAVRVTPVNGLATNVIARNGKNIMGLAEDMTINVPGASVTLEYINATVGWRIV